MGTLTLDLVKRMAAAAEARANEIGKPFAITIVDPGGHLLLVYRQDGIHAATTDVSAGKARASALFNRSSGALESAMGTEGRPTLLALTSAVPGTLALQGALPVHLPVGDPTQANLVGAIGVSGGTSPEDESVAQAGIDVLKTVAG
jgi:uncharacterized protein GlcG (DUF336 family)